MKIIFEVEQSDEILGSVTHAVAYLGDFELFEKHSKPAR